MKKLLQFFILIMIVNISTTITPSNRPFSAYEQRRTANKKRIEALNQQDDLDMRRQDRKRAIQQKQQIQNHAQKILVEILRIDLESEEYKATIFPAYSPTDPTKGRNKLSDEEKITHHNEMIKLSKATTVCNLIPHDKEPGITYTCSKHPRNISMVAQRISSAEALRAAKATDKLTVETISSPTSTAHKFSPGKR